MPKRAILFDIDGTLIDSNEAHVDAWCQAFASEDLHFDRATIHDQIGKGADNLLPSVLPGAPEALRKRIEEAHSAIYRERYLDHVEPFPHARDLLVKTRDAGKKVLFASSASRPELDHYVRLLDAGDIIDGVTSNDDVARSKPCPDIFEAAARKADVEPADALVVGDTPYDIIAARRSGIATIVVRSGRFPEAELEEQQPLAIYDDVASLLADFRSSPICR
jgi:membrane protein